MCGCKPFSATTSAIVAPALRRSMVIMVACFVPSRRVGVVAAAGAVRAALFAGTAVFARIVVSAALALIGALAGVLLATGFDGAFTSRVRLMARRKATRSARTKAVAWGPKMSAHASRRF